ncbi:hypothetical protein PV392_27590 [Streptomyces sp. ME03-5709C]|nr:hypothetical protein [Streptomyces sp. ME03-5709C]
MHSYRCGRCGITSPPYLLRAFAERHGASHRDSAHHGDHPDGECIVTAAHERPQAGDVRVFLIVAALLAVALLGKLF